MNARRGFQVSQLSSGLPLGALRTVPEKTSERNSVDYGEDSECRVSAEYKAPRFHLGDRRKALMGETRELVNH